MEVEEAYLFSSSKVRVQGHWTFIKKKMRHLDHCGQVDIPRTMQSPYSKLVCTLHMEVEVSN